MNIYNQSQSLIEINNSIEFIHSNIIFQRHLTNYIQLKKIYYNAQKINRLIIYTNNHKLNERRNVIEYNEDWMSNVMYINKE